MIRGKILFISLVIMAAIAAALGVTQLWWMPMGWTLFTKSLVTLLILGTLASFLMAVDYDMPGSKGRKILWIIMLISLVASALVIVQMWWAPFAMSLFTKIFITLLILGGLLSLIAALIEDFSTNKKLKDDNFID